MGLRPLDLDQWLEVDERRTMNSNRSGAARRPTTTWSWRRTPRATRRVAKLLDEVTRFFEVLSRDCHRRSPDDHPVVAAARLVQEDLCVLVRSDVWRLQAACVCFPSRWNLASKLGTTLDDIHRPVPIYDVELSRPTNAFFERLKPDALSGASTGRYRLTGPASAHQRPTESPRRSRRLVLPRRAPDASSPGRSVARSSSRSTITSRRRKNSVSLTRTSARRSC